VETRSPAWLLRVRCRRATGKLSKSRVAAARSLSLRPRQTQPERLHTRDGRFETRENYSRLFGAPECRLWVKPGNAPQEPMFSAFAPIGDIPRHRRQPPEIERQPDDRRRRFGRIQPEGRAVIPGRVEDANPESRDSGSAPTAHPGMTSMLTRRWREKPLPPRAPRRGFPHASIRHRAASRTAAPARWRDRTS